MKQKKPIGLIISLVVGIPLFICVVGFLILFVIAWFELDGGTSSSGAPEGAYGNANVENSEDMDTWAIYWYMCGTDLESEDGLASINFEEAFTIDGMHPENVTFVIEAGGCREWHNDIFSSDCLTRVVVHGSKYEVVDKPALANMGLADTLADFLTFCNTNYPADHTMVLFWDHGGGTMDGACLDELYDFDALSLDEIYEAFAKSNTLSCDNPPYDIVGFDCCLMATLDVANVLSDVAHYMVASEEIEPGYGWNYIDWVGAVNDNPNITPKELGEVICKTYIDHCNDFEVENYYTLSLLDLSKMKEVLTAYDALGLSAIKLTAKDTYFYTDFARNVGNSKSFGGVSEAEGVCTLVDLSDFAERISDRVSEAKNLKAAIDEMVVYNGVGPRAGNSNGLSFYYSVNGGEENLKSFMEIGAGSSFKYFYSLGMMDTLDEAGRTYLSENGVKPDEISEIKTLKMYENEDISLKYDENEQRYGVKLDEEKAKLVSSVKYEMYAIYEDLDSLIFLGYDDEIECDWDKGAYYEGISGTWGAIEGIPVFMDLVYKCDEYNEYSVAIDIEGYEAVLKVYYDFDDGSWSVGNAYYVSEDGIATRDTLELEDGMRIGVLCYSAPISSDEEFMPYVIDYFTYSDDISFSTVALDDGEYALRFEMSDALHNKMYSDFLLFDIESGEIFYNM